MTEYDLNDEANVNFLTEAYRLPEGFIGALPDDEKNALDCAIHFSLQVQRDEGNREWSWCVGDVLNELNSEIQIISGDYAERYDDDTEDALSSIETASSLIKKLLPIYADQLMEELNWHEKVVSEADQITVEKLVENSKKQQAIYAKIIEERNAA